MQLGEKMEDNLFSKEYFTSYLQESCGLSQEKDDTDKCLIKLSNITIGHVLAAHSLGSFTDQNILQWIRKGRKLTPLVQNQFELYRKLAKYLISSVGPEDVSAWKELLNDTKYVWPTEGREVWVSMFGEEPNLCKKIDLEKLEDKESLCNLSEVEILNEKEKNPEHIAEDCSLPEDLQEILIESEDEKNCHNKDDNIIQDKDDDYKLSIDDKNKQAPKDTQPEKLWDDIKEEDSERKIPESVGDKQIEEFIGFPIKIEDVNTQIITQVSEKDSERNISESIGEKLWEDIEEEDSERKIPESLGDKQIEEFKGSPIKIEDVNTQIITQASEKDSERNISESIGDILVEESSDPLEIEDICREIITQAPEEDLEKNISECIEDIQAEERKGVSLNIEDKSRKVITQSSKKDSEKDVPECIGDLQIEESEGVSLEIEDKSKEIITQASEDIISYEQDIVADGVKPNSESISNEDDFSKDFFKKLLISTLNSKSGSKSKNVGAAMAVISGANKIKSRYAKIGKYLGKFECITPQIEKQFIMYHNLYEYLMSEVPSTDVPYWKKLLIENEYREPVENNDLWGNIFGEDVINIKEICMSNEGRILKQADEVFKEKKETESNPLNCPESDSTEDRKGSVNVEKEICKELIEKMDVEVMKSTIQSETFSLECEKLEIIEKEDGNILNSELKKHEDTYEKKMYKADCSTFEGNISESQEIENMETSKSKECINEGENRYNEHYVELLSKDNKIMSETSMDYSNDKPESKDKLTLEHINDSSKVETSLFEIKKEDLVNMESDEVDNSDSEAFGADFFENDFFSDEENDDCNESKEGDEKCIEEEDEMFDVEQQECEKSKEEDDGNVDAEELDYDENIESETEKEGDVNENIESETEKEEDIDENIESETKKEEDMDPDFLQIHVDEDYSDLVPEDEMRNSESISSKTNSRKQSSDVSISSKTQSRKQSSDVPLASSSKNYNEKQSYDIPSTSSKEVSENLQDPYSALFQSHLATIEGNSEKKITHVYVITETHNKSVLSRVFKWWLPNHNVILVDKVLDTEAVFDRVRSSKSLYSFSKVEKGLWIILPSIYSIVTPKINNAIIAMTPIPTLSNVTFDWESSDVIADHKKNQERENKRLSSIVSRGKDFHKKLSETLGRNHMVVLVPPIPAAVCGVSTEIIDVIRMGKLSVAFEKFSLRWTELARKIFLNFSPMHDLLLDYHTELSTRQAFVKSLKDTHNDSLDTHYKYWEVIFENIKESCNLSGDDPITKFNHVIVVGHQLAVTKLKKLLNPNVEFYTLHLNFQDINLALESMKKLPLEKTNTLWIIPTDVSNWIPRCYKDVVTTQTIERVLRKSDFPKKAVKFVDKLREKLGKDSSVLLTPMIPQTFLYVPQGMQASDEVNRASDVWKLMIVEQHGRNGSTSLSTCVQSAHKLWMSRDSPVEHAVNKQNLPEFLYKEYLEQMLKYDGGTVEVLKSPGQDTEVPKGYKHWQDYISAIVKFIYTPLNQKSTLISNALKSESKKINNLYKTLSIEVGTKYLGELNSLSSIKRNGLTDIFVILDAKCEKYLAPLNENFQEIITAYRKPTINWIIEKDLSIDSFKSTVDGIIEDAENSLIMFIPMHTDSYTLFKNMITTLVQDLMTNPLKSDCVFLVSPPIPSYALNGNKQFITQNYMISNTQNWITFGHQLCSLQSLFSEIMKVSSEHMSKSIESIPLYSLIRADEEFFPSMQSWYEMMLSMFFIETRPSSNNSTKLRDFKKFVIIGDQDVEEGFQWKSENTVYKDMSIKLSSADFALDTFKMSLSEHLKSNATLFIIITDSTPWLTPQSFCNRMHHKHDKSVCSEDLKMYGILNMSDAKYQTVHIKNYIKKTKEFVKKAQEFIHPESAIIFTPIIPQSLVCAEEEEINLEKLYQKAYLERLHRIMHEGPKKKLFRLFHPMLESKKVVSYLNMVDGVWNEGVKQIMEMQKIPSELVDVYVKRCSKISTATINCKDFCNDIRHIPAYPHWLGLLNAYARLLTLGPERKCVEEAVEKKERILRKQGTERKSVERAIESSNGSVFSRATAIGAVLQHRQSPIEASTHLYKDLKDSASVASSKVSISSAKVSSIAIPPSAGVSSGSIPGAWVSTFSSLPPEARPSGSLSVCAAMNSNTSVQPARAQPADVPAMGIPSPAIPSTWIPPPGNPPNVVQSSLIGPTSISKAPIIYTQHPVVFNLSVPPPGLPYQSAPLPVASTTPSNLAFTSPVQETKRGIQTLITKKLKGKVCIEDIPNMLHEKDLENILGACGAYTLFERQFVPGTSCLSECSVIYNQIDCTLRCERLLHLRSIMSTKIKVTIPYQMAITKEEREHWYQDLDTEAESSIKKYIQSAEDKLKNPSVNVKDISEKVNEAKKHLSVEIAKVKLAFAKKAKEFEIAQSKNVKEKNSQRTASKTPERRNKRSRSKSPNRRKRLDHKSPERMSIKLGQKDKRNRRPDSRSPDRRNRRSRSTNRHDRSRSSERRSRKSRSKERIKKQSGKHERSPVREKRVCSRSPSRVTKSNKKPRPDDIKKREEIVNIFSESELYETDIAISDSDDIRVIAIMTPIFDDCGGKQLFCDSYAVGYRFKTKQRARVVYKLLNRFRTPLGRAKLKCSQKVNTYLPEDSQESMLVMGIINESLKKSQHTNVEILNKLATQKDKLDPYLFKTKKCMFMFGNCINNRKCICYHNKDQVRRNPAKIEYLPTLCSQFQLGSCSEGNACTNCHTKYELIFHPERVHKKVCSDWYAKGPCKLDYDSTDCCINAHPETPEVFFNDVWRDMYIPDLKHTYQYLVGAIHNLRFVNTQREGVYLMLVTPSIYMIHWLIGATLNLTKALKLVVHMVTNDTAITEKEKQSKVLFCTPGGVIRLLDAQGVNLSHTLAGVILDDVTLLLHQNKDELATIGKALMSSSLGLCRVAVADKVYKQDVSNLSELFFTKFNIFGTISSSEQDKGLPSSATIDSILSSSKNRQEVTSKDNISLSKNSRHDERPKGVIAQHRKKVSSEARKNPNEFSAVEACLLLMGFCDKIGILGHSLKAVLKKTQKYGNDSHKVIESLNDSESQELLVLIAGKFKRLREETQDPILLANYIQACIATNSLIENTKLYLETSKLGKEKLPRSLESQDKKNYHENSKGAYESRISSSVDKIERYDSVSSSKKYPSRTYESIISSLDSGDSNMDHTMSRSTIRGDVSDLSNSINANRTSNRSSVSDIHNIIDRSNIADIRNAPSKIDLPKISSISDTYNKDDRGNVADLIDERLRHILQKTINDPKRSSVYDSYYISNRNSVANISSADDRSRSPNRTSGTYRSRSNDGNVSSSSGIANIHNDVSNVSRGIDANRSSFDNLSNAADTTNIISKPGSSTGSTQSLGFDLNAEDILLIKRILGKPKDGGSSASPPRVPQRSEETEAKSVSLIPSAISGMLDEIGEPMDLGIDLNLPRKNRQIDSGGERRVNDPNLYLQKPGPSQSYRDSSPRFINGMFKVALFGHEFIDLLPFHSGETFTSKTPDNLYQVIKYAKNGAEIFKVHEYSIFKDVISAQPDMIFLILGRHDISTYITPQEIADRMRKIKIVLEKNITDVRIICFGLEDRQSDSGWISYQDKLNRCLGAVFETVIFPTAQVDIGNKSYESVKRVWSYMQGFIDDIHLQQLMLRQLYAKLR